MSFYQHDSCSLLDTIKQHFYVLPLTLSRRQKLIDTIKLPISLSDWKRSADEAEIWHTLNPLFRKHDIELWKPGYLSRLTRPGIGYPPCSGFIYISPHLQFNVGSGGGRDLKYKTFPSALLRVANNNDGVAVVIQLVVRRNEGKEHLSLWRRFGTGIESSVATNHMLPLWREVVYEDMIFAVSPQVQASVQEFLDSDVDGKYNNSVGDIVDMILQCIEALVYLHTHRVAHRDAFIQNYLVQWMPQSLSRSKPLTTRPRVYLIDLEMSVEFPADCPINERLVVGPPSSSPFYKKLMPPEGKDDQPYCPFKADVWQLGWHLQQFSAGIESLDAVLRAMVHPDPLARSSSQDLLDILSDIVSAIVPQQLHIPPTVTAPPFDPS